MLNNQIRFDINCDLGEGDSAASFALDKSLMEYINRCNIACGGHAGDTHSMNTSLKNAREHKLKVGAHPSYPDRKNFGRKSINLSFSQLCDSLTIQIDSLVALAKINNTPLTHIKCHGALYNDIENSFSLAQSLAEFFQSDFPELALMGLAGGQLQKAAVNKNITFISEGFVDRGYLANGLLAPRNLKGAVLSDANKAVSQAIALTQGSNFFAIDGSPLAIKVDSLCIHGDTPNALSFAKQLKYALLQLNKSK